MKGHIFWDEGGMLGRTNIEWRERITALDVRCKDTHEGNITRRTISDCVATDIIISIITYYRQNANNSQQTCAPSSCLRHHTSYGTKTASSS